MTNSSHVILAGLVAAAKTGEIMLADSNTPLRTVIVTVDFICISYHG
jgi:hypothetical protein